MEYLELIKTNRKYYNVSPIECFESYLNKSDISIQSWNCTTGLIYTHSDKHIYEVSNSLNSHINITEFNYINLLECLILYPNISLLTTFHNETKVEPLYIVTYIQDISDKQMEIYDNVEIEAYTFEYNTWCDKVIGYSIIRPINLIEFIIQSISATQACTNTTLYDYAKNLNIDDSENYENYDNVDDIFENISKPLTSKETKTIKICKKAFPRATYEFLEIS